MEGSNSAKAAGSSHAAPVAADAKPVCRRVSRVRANIVLIGLGIFLIVAFLVSLVLGRYPMSVGEVLGMLGSKVFPIEQFWEDRQEILFFNTRLPRVILVMLVGCCLSTAGAAFQGTFQNPLVSPDILGASQGAALGAAIAILMGLSSFATSLWAFAFSLLSVVLVMFVSGRAKGNHMMVVVLSGVMVSSLFSAAVSYTKLIADPNNTLPNITYWLMGSMTGATVSDIRLCILPMALGLVVLFGLRWRINILTMGDDEAATMGVNARMLRIAVMLAATLITAASVAVSGIIGWVGLVIPHLCRMLIGCDYRKLLPASMLMGAGFLLVVDDISRLATTAEIPIGILTAFIGAPFFLYLITRKKGA